MSLKIKAFIINRNLLTTLHETITFLQKEPRIEIVIIDMQSTHPELLTYYESLPVDVTVYYCDKNAGPNYIWDDAVRHLHNEQPFILTDADLSYQGVPDDWLDVMLAVLNETAYFKVGFSLRINDLPPTPIAERAKEWETKFWTDKNEHGYVAHIDTTFALYRSNSRFSYDALRLAPPYTARHIPWYINPEKINEEWTYYINHAGYYSSWGSMIKEVLANQKS